LRHGEVSVDNLARHFKVSSATIRRDLTELERQGLLRRNHGGAHPVTPMLYEAFRNLSSFQEQEQKCAAEKRQIGLTAASLISDGETVAIGAGTTTTQLARSIRHRKGITIVTNAVNIAMELSHLPEIKVSMTGGSLSGDWFALVGDVAQQNVSQTFFDKAFIGVDGAHADRGLTTNYPDQAAIHRAMMRQAQQRVVLADHRRRDMRGAIDAGADAVVLESRLAVTLGVTLRAVCAGQACVPRELRRQVERPLLSNRERQVLAMVAAGFSNGQIADHLFLAESTIKGHLSSAFSKLGIHSREEASALVRDPEARLGIGLLPLPAAAQPATTGASR